MESLWLSFSCLQFRHCQPRQVYGCAIEHGNIVLNADTAAGQQLFHQGPVDTGLVWTLPKLRQQYEITGTLLNLSILNTLQQLYPDESK